MSVSVRLAGLGAALAAFATMAHAQPLTPGFTADQAKRGQELYAGACLSCHGESLDDGQFGPPLKGPAHKDYWAGRTAGDVLEYMAANMPPFEPGGLGAQAYADIMAYMLQSAGAAPGDTELPADPEAARSADPTR